jgi:hypothetical protein
MRCCAVLFPSSGPYLADDPYQRRLPPRLPNSSLTSGTKEDCRKVVSSTTSSISVASSGTWHKSDARDLRHLSPKLLRGFVEKSAKGLSTASIDSLFAAACESSRLRHDAWPRGHAVATEGGVLRMAENRFCGAGWLRPGGGPRFPSASMGQNLAPSFGPLHPTSPQWRRREPAIRGSLRGILSFETSTSARRPPGCPRGLISPSLV